jgi:hypothetical protein
MADTGEKVRMLMARIELGFMRVRQKISASKPVVFARRRPAVAVGLIVAVLAVVGGGVAWAVAGPAALNPFRPEKLSDLRADAKENPKDASAQRELGHAQFQASQRGAALSSYDRALRLDRSVEDGTLDQNLVACFGTPLQDEAEAVIRRYKLAGTAHGLDPLVRSSRPSVRWGALKTLDALGKASRADWAAAYVLDLQSSDCDVRRRAVEKLAKIGDKGDLAAIRKANSADAKTGGLFHGTCLGDRPEKAEKAIIARK